MSSSSTARLILNRNLISLRLLYLWYLNAQNPILYYSLTLLLIDASGEVESPYKVSDTSLRALGSIASLVFLLCFFLAAISDYSCLTGAFEHACWWGAGGIGALRVAMDCYYLHFIILVL